MRKLHLLRTLILLLVPSGLFAQNPAKRPIAIDDIYRMEKVGNPQVSPEGNWVAYTLTTVDKEADKRRTALCMVNWEGTQDVQLTFGKQSSSSPKWSPDGRYLSFLSSDGEKSKAQIWLLDRRGGAPQQLTNVKQEIDDYRWSPDGKRILLEMSRGRRYRCGRQQERRRSSESCEADRSGSIPFQARRRRISHCDFPLTSVFIRCQHQEAGSANQRQEF